MKRWKTLQKEILKPTDKTTLAKEKVELPDGSVSEYAYIDSKGSVMVIPIKMDDPSGQPKYILVQQYRHPVTTYDLEFPAGGREPGESSQDAARRELKQETGYDTKNIKFLYSLFSSPSVSNNQLAVYIALVEGDHSNDYAESGEKQAFMKVVELSTEELHKKVLENEITDSQTLAALSVYLLNSQAAKKYLQQSTENV